MKSTTILIASYEDPKIMETIAQFQKFTTKNELKDPTTTKLPKVSLQIHGCDGNDLKKKSIFIEGPSEKLIKLSTVKVPKGIILKFI